MALRPVFISGVVYALLAGAAGAETIALTATLSGANEVPPVTSPGNGDA